MTSNTRPTVGAAPVDITNLRLQFTHHLLAANTDLNAMREAFDRLAAARHDTPAATTPATSTGDGPQPIDLNPLLADNLADTVSHVTAYLEVLASAANALGEEGVTGRFAEGLYLATWVAVAALRVHLPD